MIREYVNLDQKTGKPAIVQVQETLALRHAQHAGVHVLQVHGPVDKPVGGGNTVRGTSLFHSHRAY